MANSVIETVQKPLTERYWPWTFDPNRKGWNWRRVIGNRVEEVLTKYEADKIQSLEDQPLLIAEIQRLESLLSLKDKELERLKEIGKSAIEISVEYSEALRHTQVFRAFRSALKEKGEEV